MSRTPGKPSCARKCPSGLLCRLKGKEMMFLLYGVGLSAPLPHHLQSPAAPMPPLPQVGQSRSARATTKPESAKKVRAEKPSNPMLRQQSWEGQVLTLSSERAFLLLPGRCEEAWEAKCPECSQWQWEVGKSVLWSFSVSLWFCHLMSHAVLSGDIGKEADNLHDYVAGVLAIPRDSRSTCHYLVSPPLQSLGVKQNCSLKASCHSPVTGVPMTIYWATLGFSHHSRPWVCWSGHGDEGCPKKLVGGNRINISRAKNII